MDLRIPLPKRGPEDPSGAEIDDLGDVTPDRDVQQASDGGSSPCETALYNQKRRNSRGEIEPLLPEGNVARPEGESSPMGHNLYIQKRRHSREPSECSSEASEPSRARSQLQQGVDDDSPMASALYYEKRAQSRSTSGSRRGPSSPAPDSPARSARSASTPKEMLRERVRELEEDSEPSSPQAAQMKRAKMINQGMSGVPNSAVEASGSCPSNPCLESDSNHGLTQAGLDELSVESGVTESESEPSSPHASLLKQAKANAQGVKRIDEELLVDTPCSERSSTRTNEVHSPGLDQDSLDALSQESPVDGTLPSSPASSMLRRIKVHSQGAHAERGGLQGQDAESHVDSGALSQAHLDALSNECVVDDDEPLSPQASLLRKQKVQGQASLSGRSPTSNSSPGLSQTGLDALSTDSDVVGDDAGLSSVHAGMMRKVKAQNQGYPSVKAQPLGVNQDSSLPQDVAGSTAGAVSTNTSPNTQSHLDTLSAGDGEEGYSDGSSSPVAGALRRAKALQQGLQPVAGPVDSLPASNLPKTQLELDALSAGEEGYSDGSSSPAAGSMKRAKAYGQGLQPVEGSVVTRPASTSPKSQLELDALSAGDGEEGYSDGSSSPAAGALRRAKAYGQGLQPVNGSVAALPTSTSPKSQSELDALSAGDGEDGYSDGSSSPAAGALRRAKAQQQGLQPVIETGGVTQAELDSLSAEQEGGLDCASSPAAGALRRAKAQQQGLQPVIETGGVTQAELDGLSAEQEGGLDCASSPAAGALRRAKAYGQGLQPVAESGSQKAVLSNEGCCPAGVTQENLNALSNPCDDEGNNEASSPQAGFLRKKKAQKASWSDVQMESQFNDLLSQVGEVENTDVGVAADNSKQIVAETHRTKGNEDGLSQVVLDSLSEESNVEKGAPSSPQATLLKKQKALAQGLQQDLGGEVEIDTLKNELQAEAPPLPFLNETGSNPSPGGMTQESLDALSEEADVEGDGDSSPHGAMLRRAKAHGQGMQCAELKASADENLTKGIPKAAPHGEHQVTPPSSGSPGFSQAELDKMLLDSTA